MTRIGKIEKEIAALSPKEIRKLATWLAGLEADLWDKQIEDYAKAGRLDKLAKQALADHRAGLTNPL